MKAVVLFVISALVIWFAYWLVDSSGARQIGHGVVLGKKFIEGHWQTTWITTTQSDGNGGNTTSSYPQMNWIPDGYVLRIHIADHIKSASVSKELYESIQEGENISVEFSKGRLSKSKVFIKRVWK